MRAGLNQLSALTQANPLKHAVLLAKLELYCYLSRLVSTQLVTKRLLGLIWLPNPVMRRL